MLKAKGTSRALASARARASVALGRLVAICGDSQMRRSWVWFERLNSRCGNCSGNGNLARLRQEVTSTGGTTEAALRALEAADLRATVRAALNAATQRGRELAMHAR